MHITDEILARTIPPDYVIMVGFKGATNIAIRRIDAAGIKTAFFNAALPDSMMQALTTGPTKLKHLVGIVLPDEEQAGYLLAQQLVEQARTLSLKNANGKIVVYALTGSVRAHESEKRVRGLLQYISEQSDVVLSKVDTANWNRDLANVLAHSFLAKNLDTSVIWAASDGMAIGALHAAKAHNRQANIDIVLGGIDWVPDIFPYIDNDEITASVGGHIFDGVRLLQKIYNYHQNIDTQFFSQLSQFDSLLRKDLATIKHALTIDNFRRLDLRALARRLRYTNEEQLSAWHFVVNPNTKAIGWSAPGTVIIGVDAPVRELRKAPFNKRGRP